VGFVRLVLQGDGGAGLAVDALEVAVEVQAGLLADSAPVEAGGC
jgi:hypothetical protein